MAEQTLAEIAKAIVAEGKGILAGDESSGSIRKKLAGIGVEDSPENHRRYREMLLTTPEIEKYISGVIMFDETMRQTTSSGVPFAQYLSSRGIVPGIKTDIGLKDMEDHPGEQIGKWDETLNERLKEYYVMGARFSKWRIVINIGADFPTDKCIEENIALLVKFASLCQANNILPIVEPEVIMDGSHTIEMCYEVTKKTLALLFLELKKANVDIRGLLLKPNMVMYSSLGKKVSAEEVAEKTLQCFMEVVPAEMPGIVFLSGGQSEAEACENLNAIAKLAKEKNAPWKLTFSFGRALQNSASQIWAGKDENLAQAQAAFLKRAKLSGAASTGDYKIEME